MHAWGLRNGKLVAWDFGAAYGRAGWTNDRLAAHIISPVKDALVAEALAWTPGTKGAVRAAAVQVTLPQRPTKESLTEYFEKLKPVVAGKIVLVGLPQQVLVTFNKPELRREEADVLAQLNAPPPPQNNQNQAPNNRQSNNQQNNEPQPLTNAQIQEQLNRFLVDNGVLVRINDAGRDHGQIRAFGPGNGNPNSGGQGTVLPPTVVMRNEDYGRIWRLLNDGRAVELEFDIVNTTYPEGRTAYNVIADIPGTDKADEVVMLGGHLDSWHSATGSTDNAIGCAVMMEAARILVAVGAQPRRTVRLALWTGEEQGLLGSQAYVREHFGTAEEPKPEFAKFAGYINMDTGTGMARGLQVFGPPETAAVLREIVAPMRDLGVLGAMATRSRQRGGTDHTSFNEAGLPGINLMQDPMEYGTYTWHTNLDTYERVVEDDVKKAAIVVASTVYHLAMRDEPLPRFKSDELPRRPQQTPPAPAPAPAPAAATGAAR
jgi:carboxypeptidase Q